MKTLLQLEVLIGCPNFVFWTLLETIDSYSEIELWQFLMDFTQQ